MIHQYRCQIFMAQMNKRALVLCQSWKRESREVHFMPSEAFWWTVLISCSVMSHSLQPHEQQHTRLPYPSLTPGACSNSCPWSQGRHPIISSFVIPFSSRFQYFPGSGSFLMSMERGTIILCHMQKANQLWVLALKPSNTLCQHQKIIYIFINPSKICCPDNYCITSKLKSKKLKERKI